MADGNFVDGSCWRCGTVNDLTIVPIDGAKPICRRCAAIVTNECEHECRGCGRTFSRLDGMHSTALDPDGELRTQDQRWRTRGETEWQTRPEIIVRVICAACCPAKTHDDGEWCSIMHPVAVPGE